MSDQLSQDFQDAFDALPVPENPFLAAMMTAAAAYDISVPDRTWIWDQFIPSGATTLLTGSGGDGKSLLAMLIGTHVAAGVPLFGQEVAQGHVLGIFGEDEADELVRRQKSIMNAGGIAPHDVENFRFMSLFGRETLLGSFEKQSGAFVESALYRDIRQSALEFGARLVILDNVTQMYGGDVNDRGTVTRFVQALNRLALEIGGAVLLLGHIAKSEGSSYAGTTAWRDGVRQALMLSRPDQPNKLLHQTKPGCERHLRVTKSNYGGQAEASIYWDRGSFTVVGGSHVNIAHSLADDENEFLRLLDLMTTQEIATSASANAITYAPRIMAERFGATRGRMQRALDSLLEDGRVGTVELGWQRSGRKTAVGLALLPDQTAPAGYRSPLAQQPTADDLMDRIRRRLH